VKLDDPDNDEIVEAVIAASRKNYAKKYVAKKKEKTNTKKNNKDTGTKKGQTDDGNSGGEQLLSDSEGVN
jgi:hypothetical protein